MAMKYLYKYCLIAKIMKKKIDPDVELNSGTNTLVLKFN